MDKDAFYFPHFSNARHDRKIKRLRKELGLEGYGIYFMILETLREQAEYNYPIEDIDLLADEFGTSEQKIRIVISNYELFTTNESEHFFSPKMMVYLTPYLESKERKKIGGIKGNLIRYKHITKEQAKTLTDEEILNIHKNLEYKRSVSDKLSLPSVSDSDSDRLFSQRKVNNKQINNKQINNKQINNKQYFQCEELDYFADDNFQEAWSEWMKIRKSKKGAFTEYAFKKIYNKFIKYARNVEDAITILDKSIVSGWTDIYELSTSTTSKNYTPDKWKGEQNFDF